MDRRQGLVALALIGLGAAGALWLALGTRQTRATSAPPDRAAASAAAGPAAVVPARPRLAPAKARPKPAPSDAGSVAEPTRSVVVQVNSIAGKPIAGARVALQVRGEGESPVGETDATGAARFVNVPGDLVLARADAEGFAGKDLDVQDNRPGAEVHLSIALAPGVPFDGTVVEWPGGAPVEGAEVNVQWQGSLPGYSSTASRGGVAYDSALTDAQGRFHVRGVPEGQRVVLFVSASGFLLGATDTIQVIDGKVTPLPVVVWLERGGRVTGVVRDPNGAGVVGATVYVMPASGDNVRDPRKQPLNSFPPKQEPYQRKSGDGGAYVVDGLPPADEYIAYAEAPSFGRSDEARGLHVDRAQPVVRADFSLRPPVTVIVRLVDLAGNRLTEAVEVRLQNGGSDQAFIVQEEGAKDVFRFEGLSAGDYPLSVSSESFLPASTLVHGEPGATVELTVRLDPGVSIEGVVVDEGGTPVARAAVQVRSVAESESGADPSTRVDRWPHSDEQGRFVARGLKAGDSEVTAETWTTSESYPMHTLDPIHVRVPAKDVRLVLVRFGTASIRVLTPDGKPYVGRASLQCWRTTEGPSEGSGDSDYTDDARFFWFSLDEGEREVEVAVDGFVAIRRTFTAHLRTHVNLGDVTLDTGFDVEGRVTDLSGVAFPGARVNGKETDTKGVFTLRHLPHGRHRLSIHVEGIPDREQDVDVQPSLGPVVIALAMGALVKVVARRADGTPADEEYLVATPVGEPGVPHADPEDSTRYTHDGGHFEWRLTPGRWRISWSPGESEDVVLGEWTFAEGETRDLELTLPKR